VSAGAQEHPPPEDAGSVGGFEQPRRRLTAPGDAGQGGSKDRAGVQRANPHTRSGPDGQPGTGGAEQEGCRSSSAGHGRPKARSPFRRRSRSRSPRRRVSRSASPRPRSRGRRSPGGHRPGYDSRGAQQQPVPRGGRLPPEHQQRRGQQQKEQRRPILYRQGCGDSRPMHSNWLPGPPPVLEPGRKEPYRQEAGPSSQSPLKPWALPQRSDGQREGADGPTRGAGSGSQKDRPVEGATRRSAPFGVGGKKHQDESGKPAGRSDRGREPVGHPRTPSRSLSPNHAEAEPHPRAKQAKSGDLPYGQTENVAAKGDADPREEGRRWRQDVGIAWSEELAKEPRCPPVPVAQESRHGTADPPQGREGDRCRQGWEGPSPQSFTEGLLRTIPAESHGGEYGRGH
jgi:hypothetical protein